MDISREFRRSKFINTVIAQGLSIFANLFLAFLVKKHSSKLLAAYKKILMLGIICNLMSSITGVLLQTTIYINNDQAYLIPEGLLGSMSEPFAHTLLIVHIFSANFDVAILPVQYIYRYILLCHRRTLTLHYFTLLCIIAAIFPAVIAAGYITACWPDENYPTYAQALKTKDWLFPDGSIPGFIVCSLGKVGTTHFINNLMFIVVYVIIIYCCLRVVLTLRALKKSTSAQAQKLQSQITFILFIQALLPLIIQVIPQFASSYFGSMSPQAIKYFNILLMYLTAWAPLTSPVCIIFIIGSYRVVVFNYCRYLVGKKPKPMVTSKVGEITAIAGGVSRHWTAVY